MPGEGSRNPLQAIQPSGAVPQAVNLVDGDQDFTSNVETGLTSHSNAPDVRKSSKRKQSAAKKGHTSVARPKSTRQSKPTEKKQATTRAKKEEEPWNDDEELSVMLGEVGKARRRANLNRMGKPLVCTPVSVLCHICTTEAAAARPHRFVLIAAVVFAGQVWTCGQLCQWHVS